MPQVIGDDEYGRIIASPRKIGPKTTDPVLPVGALYGVVNPVMTNGVITPPVQTTQPVIPQTLQSTTPTDTQDYSNTSSRGKVREIPSSIINQFVPEAPQPSPVQQPQQQSQVDIAAMIQQLKDAYKAQNVANLTKAMNSQLQNLQGERAGIQPKYYDARNQANAASQVQARNFAEFMANRGGTNSGANAQAELSRNMSLQGNVGQLNRQEIQNYADIANRETGIKNAYESDVASANAGADAQAMQNLIEQYRADQARQDQLNQFNKNYDLQLNQFNKNYDLQTRQLTNAEKQQSFDNAMAQANFDENKAQNAFTRDLQAKGFTADQAQREWSNMMAEKQFNWDTNTTNNPQLVGQIQQNKIDKAQFDEWQKQAPQRLQLINAQVRQATDENSLNALKLQAQQLENQLAKINLKYAPLQAQQQIAQSKAQIANVYSEISTRQAELALSKQKASQSNSNSSNNNSSNPKYNYKTDQGFQDDLVNVNANPEKSLEAIQANSQAFIKKYGVDGYNALVNAAKKALGGN